MNDEYIDVKKIVCKKESWIKRYVRTIDKKLSVITISALIFSLLYKLLFLQWEAPYEAIYNLGDWTFILSMSILSAAIFYFFTVHYPMIQDREKYSDIVNESILSLITKTETFIISNFRSYYIDFQFSGNIPSEDEWNNRVNSQTSETEISWIEDSYGIINNTKKEFEILSNYRDEYKDVFLIVSKLYSTSLLRSEDPIKHSLESGENISLSLIEPLLFDYLQAIEPLYEYYNEIITEMLTSQKIVLK